MSHLQSATWDNVFLFTTYTLAKNLGWTKDHTSRNKDEQSPNSRFEAAFKVLIELLLPEAVSSKELEGITQKDAIAVANAVSKQVRNAKAKGNNPESVRRKAAKEAIKEVQSERAERDKEKRIKQAAGRAQPKKEKQIPPIERYAQKFIEKMKTVKNPYSSILKEGERILPHLDSLDDALASKVASEIKGMLKRHTGFALSLAEAFEETNRKRIRRLLIEGRKGK